MKIRKYLMFGFVNLQDLVVWQLAKSRRIHRVLLAPGIEGFRWRIGRWRAWRTFEYVRKNVPAYKDYVAKVNSGAPKRTKHGVDFEDVHPMSKDEYIKQYSIEDRCVKGVIPDRNVVVDESSGSSGHPTSWVRGEDERELIKKIMQVGLIEIAQPKQIFILNAFALGAWATGMMSSMSLVDISIIKSTGPDMKKIIDTIKEFGPKYHYIILGYPPFLKNLADNDTIDWSEYNVMAIFGGEAISESMRDYLLKSFNFVGGSYGASDLEINLAHESNFTIALRKEIVGNTQLREALTLETGGAVPMVFQYNPFDYVIETNEKNELLITICRKNVLNPRIRYNIHDIGHVLRLKDLKPVLEEHGVSHILEKTETDFPILFYYGRSDLSLDYYGAVINPESIRQTLFAQDNVAELVRTFRLISYEDKDTTKHLQFAIELEEGVAKKAVDEKALKDSIIADLKENNGDFSQALSIAPVKPGMKAYAFEEGPFANSEKLKNEYIWNLSYNQAKEHGIVR